MKKILITLVVAAVLAGASVITASAANYEQSAEQLNALGLFRGTDAGYELDRAPTRAEAVTMLVRFLGLEEESKSGEYAHPFTDVPTWADEAVAIAYEKGYTTGVSDTTFDPHGTCSAQMYATFILRALGYSDESVKSTLWEDAIEFGKQVGIIDDTILTGTFLRGNMTAVSYLALIAAPQDSDFDTLLEKLVADGAVDETTAILVATWLAQLDDFNNIMAETTKETSIAATITMKLDAEDGDKDISSSVIIDMAINTDDNDLSLALAMTMDDEVEETYITNGYLYTSSNGEKIKIPLEILVGAGLEDVLSFTQIINIPPTPPYLISHVGIKTQGESVIYSIEVTGGPLVELMNQIFTAFGGNLNIGEFSDMLDDNIVMTFSADGDNVPTSFSISATLKSSTISGTITFEVEFTAFGSDVKIDFPDDLDSYIDMSAMMAALGVS